MLVGEEESFPDHPFPFGRYVCACLCVPDRLNLSALRMVKVRSLGCGGQGACARGLLMLLGGRRGVGAVSPPSFLTVTIRLEHLNGMCRRVCWGGGSPGLFTLKTVPGVSSLLSKIPPAPAPSLIRVGGGGEGFLDRAPPPVFYMGPGCTVGERVTLRLLETQYRPGPSPPPSRRIPCHLSPLRSVPILHYFPLPSPLIKPPTQTSSVTSYPPEIGSFQPPFACPIGPLP